jgi:hypothetical protein
LGLDSEAEIPYVEKETLKTYQNYNREQGIGNRE